MSKLTQCICQAAGIFLGICVRLSLIFVGLFYLVSCSASEIENARDGNILSDGSCELPCWYGIVPESTSRRDAERILGMNALVDTNTVQFFPKPIENFDVAFTEFKLTSSRGEGVLASNAGVVDHIILRNVVGLSLGDVVESLGEPTHIRLEFLDPLLCYDARLFYISKGVYLRGKTCLKSEQSEETRYFSGFEPGDEVMAYAEMPIDQIAFQSNLKSFAALSVPFTIDLPYIESEIQEWSGYGYYQTVSK